MRLWRAASATRARSARTSTTSAPKSQPEVRRPLHRHHASCRPSRPAGTEVAGTGWKEVEVGDHIGDSLVTETFLGAGMGGMVVRPLRMVTSTPSDERRSTAPRNEGCVPVILAASEP
jgi:hypothetical protein